MRRTLSLRTRFLLIVVAGVVLPLALVGAWLANAATRLGEELLRARLTESLRRASEDIGGRWVSKRSDLLTLAEHDAVQAALRDGGARGALDLTTLGASYGRLKDVVDSVAIHDERRTRQWTLTTSADRGANTSNASAITATVGVFDRASGQRLGALDARLALATLVPATAGWMAGVGAVLAIIDRTTGGSLMPLPFDIDLVEHDRFTWAGEEWITARQVLDEPPLEVVAAAPLTPYARPFQAAARRGIAALAAVTLLVFAATVLLTRRTTRSLGELARRATSIAGGAFGGSVAIVDDDEVGQVAKAFNSMADSLRRTLEALAERQSVAAVGEFAATLAHEVRNPLTAIRIDLQRLQERFPDEAPLARALRSVVRLDATVGGALRVARSGHLQLEPLDVRVPLDAAIADARPELRARGIQFERPRSDSPAASIVADRAALHQLFLNLLLNAAQATDRDGVVRVEVETVASAVIVRISDTGPGIPAEARERVFQPFYSTKPEGTGLGLAIARRIAIAHGGAIEFDAPPGHGTTAIVRLPQRPSNVVSGFGPTNTPSVST